MDDQAWEEFLGKVAAAQPEFEKEEEERKVLQQRADEADVSEREILQSLKQNQVNSGFGQNNLPTTFHEKKAAEMSNSGAQTPLSGEMPK